MLMYAVSGAVIKACSAAIAFALVESTLTTRVMLPLPVGLSTVAVPLMPVVMATLAFAPAIAGK
jgi:hypothetical protein